MSEVFCREVDSDKSAFINQCAKKYLIEKELERKSRIILHKESEYQTVRRVIERFKDLSYMEFDTIFKLYKLQYYKIDMSYFKGSQYKYQTLINLKSHVKSSTVDSSITPKIITQKLINDFIIEIKDVSHPFSKNLIKSRKVRDLLKSGCLSQEDIDFVVSDIVSRGVYKRDNKKVEKVKISKIEEERQDMNNQNTKKRTRVCVPREESRKMYNIIVENYRKGSDIVKGLLPNVKVKSLITYISYLRRFDKGMNYRPEHCPTSLWEIWKDYNQKNPINVSIIESDNKVKMNKKVQSVETSSDLKKNDYSFIEYKRFILVSEDQYQNIYNSMQIIKSDNSLEFLKGYKEAYKEANPNNESRLKIYQSMD